MEPQNRKQRVRQHVMEDESIQIVKSALPIAWVIREYRPDYGIDLAIEAFQQIDRGDESYEALGEHVFGQVKSVSALKVEKIEVKPRMNVAKFPVGTPVNCDPSMGMAFDVLKHQLDTSLLSTVQSMGASAVVYLFVVPLDVRRVFFVCLNDYIDKVLLPEAPHYSEQQSITIRIPVANEISRTENHAESTAVFRFFAKRAKFYSAFNLFAYQRHELNFCEDIPDRRRMASHFIQLLKKLDIWNDVQWPIIDDYRGWLLHLDSVLPNVPDHNWFEKHPCVFGHSWRALKNTSLELMTDLQIQQFWDGLNVLGRNYEEVCREWFLPTYYGNSLRTTE